MAAEDAGSYYMGAPMAEAYQYMPVAPNNQQYKRCNCKKAKCLKLYCVCFAAGVYCQGCNCADCSNVPEKSQVVMQERNRVLQREPMAFANKVVGPAHFKGCKCKRSRCIKKYCDCFDASVRCSEMCKCKDCHNRPDDFPGAAAAGMSGMSLAQHQAMLVALQQQAEYDPAALAQLQMLGAAGLQQEELQGGPAAAAAAAAAASGAMPPAGSGPGQGGSQPSSRSASPGLAAFLPGASQGFTASGSGLPSHCLASLSHQAVAAAAAAAAAAGSQGLVTADLTNMLHAASQEASQSLPQAHSQSQLFQLGHFAAFHQQQEQWQARCGQQQLHEAEAWHQQQQQDGEEAWHQQQQFQQQQQQDGGWPDPEAAAEDLQRPEDPAAGPGYESLQHDDAADVDMQDQHDAAAGTGAEGADADADAGAAAVTAAKAAAADNDDAPAVRGLGPVATYRRAAVRQPAAAPAASGTPAAVHRSCSAGPERYAQQEVQHHQPRASSLPPPDAAVANAAATAAVAAAAVSKGARRRTPQPGHQPAVVDNGGAVSTPASTAAAAEAAVNAQAEVGRLCGPYQVTKIEPLVYSGPPASAGGPSHLSFGGVAEEPQEQHDLQGMDNSGIAAGAATVSKQQYASVPHAQEQQQGLQECKSAPEARAGAVNEQKAAAMQKHLAPDRAAASDGHTAAADAVAAAGAAAAAAADDHGPAESGPLVVVTRTSAAQPAGDLPSQLSADAAADGNGAPAAFTGMLEDPTAAGALAAQLGLCDNVQQAAVNAAKFLRDIINLSRLAAGPVEPTGSITGSQQQDPDLYQQQQEQQQHSNAAAAAAATGAGPTGSAAAAGPLQEHHPQPGSRLRHSSSALGAAIPGSASLGHWAAMATPASKAVPAAAAAAAAAHAGSGLSPVVSAASGPSLQQQRQQHQNPAASTPQCAPPSHTMVGPSAGGAAAAGGGGGGATGQGGSAASAGSVSFAKSLGGGVYAPGAGGGITPLPLAATHGPHGGRLGSSLRGPSPLGPSGLNRDTSGFARETAGLQALLGTQARDRQVQCGPQEGTPLAAAAEGAGGSSSAARRSMHLLASGSFRLAGGNTDSPGAGSPAVSAPMSQPNGLQAVAAGCADSPAGSLSFAPSTASAAPATAQPAEQDQQERTPVFSNAQKQPCGQSGGQQELHTDAAAACGIARDSVAAAANGAGSFGRGGMNIDDTQPPHVHPACSTTPVTASGRQGAAEDAAAAAPAALAAVPTGIQTPVGVVQPGEGTVAGVHLAGQQQQAMADSASYDGRPADAAGAAEGAAGMTNLFGSAAGGMASLQDMTPSSLFIASLLAANRTPTDMFLTSPLPPIGSALRQAGLGSAGPTSATHPSTTGAGVNASGGMLRGAAHAEGAAAVCGVGLAMRGGQVTPLSLHGLQGAVCSSRRTPGSDLGGSPASRAGIVSRGGRGVRGSGMGVNALCTGILRGAAAEVSPEASWVPGQQPQQTDPAAPGAAAAAVLPGSVAPPGTDAMVLSRSKPEEEDAAASGMKPDTDKAAARAAAAAVAVDTNAGAVGMMSPTGVGPAGTMGSLLAAASFISTPRDAATSARGRPLSNDEATAEARGAKRQRLTTSSTPGSGGSKELAAKGASQQQEQHVLQGLSPRMPLPAAADAAPSAGQHEQDTKHAADAAVFGTGGGERAAAGPAATVTAGRMLPPKQQQRPQQQQQQQPSALQQLLQGSAGAGPAAHPAAPAPAAAGPREGTDMADLWNEWRLQQDLQQQREQQQQQAGGATASAVEAAMPYTCLKPLQQQPKQQQQEDPEDMQSPPVPPQHPDVQAGQGGRDRSPSMESYAAADAMLALCVIKRFGQAGNGNPQQQ